MRRDAEESGIHRFYFSDHQRFGGDRLLYRPGTSDDGDGGGSREDAMKQIRGAYALVVNSPRKLIGARDPWG